MESDAEHTICCDYELAPSLKLTESSGLATDHSRGSCGQLTGCRGHCTPCQ